MRTLISGLLLLGAGLLMIWVAGRYQQQRRVSGEVDDLLADPDYPTFGRRPLAELPPLLQAYLRKVNALQPLAALRFTQEGELRSDPNGDWRAFTATQFVAPDRVGFVWVAEITPIYVIDHYLHGHGQMWVNAGGLKTLSRTTSPEIDEGALQRYLGELIWLPMGFFNPNILWTQLDERTLEATLVDGEVRATCRFHFGEDGLIHSVTANRYYSNGDRSELRPWGVTLGDYRDVGAGFLVPATCTVTWQLDEGPFDWFRVAVTGVEPVEAPV